MPGTDPFDKDRPISLAELQAIADHALENYLRFLVPGSVMYQFYAIWSDRYCMRFYEARWLWAMQRIQEEQGGKSAK